MSIPELPKFKFDLQKQVDCYLSCDIDLYFQIKICYLRIPITLNRINDPDLWFYLECGLENSQLGIGKPIKTRQKPLSEQLCVFDEQLTFPVRIMDLERNSQLNFKIYYVSVEDDARLISVHNFAIFDSDGKFRSEQHELVLESLVDQEIEAQKAKFLKKSQVVSDYLYDNFQCHPRYPWVEAMTTNKIVTWFKANDDNPPCLTLVLRFQDFSINTPFVIMYFNSDILHPILEKQNKAFKVPFDPGFGAPNLIEEKQNCQIKSLSLARKYFRIKPNNRTRDRINIILKSPTNVALSQSDKEDIWTYRYFLLENPEALAKFLLCVDWGKENEATEGVELMKKWSKLSPSLALELLIPKYYKNSSVRIYALSCLASASDEELNLYLMNLVFNLDSLLLDIQPFFSAREELPECQEEIELSTIQMFLDFIEKQQNESLVHFLFKRCSNSHILSNSFFWYLNLAAFGEEKDSRRSIYYSIIQKAFMQLLTLSKDTHHIYKSLASQASLVDKLILVAERIKNTTVSRKSKVTLLQNLLTLETNLTNIGVSCPLEPSVVLQSVQPDSCTIFTSIQMPIKFCFETENQTDYNFILKVGDDMRQDQVILTMINILNKILLHENIDLKLTPYKVIAITPSIGLIEFISSISVAEALSNFGTIQNYFRTKSPDPDNIDPEIMENYVKSCAGYSVITYLFGVGDRHLDNLLITPQGKLFHIDFSYILGRDPKPYPPPIKLSTEMVDGMGGLNSKEFEYFLKLCTLAFIHLRRQSHTIINVFSLLVNSNLGEISAEPDKAVMKLFEKFRLDLDDVEAQSHLITLIYDSHKAVFAPFVEKIHKLAQKWRQ